MSENPKRSLISAWHLRAVADEPPHPGPIHKSQRGPWLHCTPASAAARICQSGSCRTRNDPNRLASQELAQASSVLTLRDLLSARLMAPSPESLESSRSSLGLAQLDDVDQTWSSSMGTLAFAYICIQHVCRSALRRSNLAKAACTDRERSPPAAFAQPVCALPNGPVKKFAGLSPVTGLGGFSSLPE